MTDPLHRSARILPAGSIPPLAIRLLVIATAAVLLIVRHGVTDPALWIGVAYCIASFVLFAAMTLAWIASEHRRIESGYILSVVNLQLAIAVLVLFIPFALHASILTYAIAVLAVFLLSAMLKRIARR